MHFKIKYFLFILLLTMFNLSAKSYDKLYYTLEKPLFVDSADIIEFFSFYCYQCYRFDSTYYEIIKERLPKNITIDQYHVSLFDEEKSKILTKSWSIAKILDIQDKIKLPFFNMIHNNKYHNINDLKKIFFKYAKINFDQFDDMNNNLLVKSFFIKQEKLALLMKISSVPTILVKGKYILNLENINNSSVNNFIEEYLELIDFLMNKK